AIRRVVVACNDGWRGLVFPLFLYFWRYFDVGMLPSKRLIIFLVGSILLISFVFYGYQICFTPNILVGREQQVIVIPRNATFKDVQYVLHKDSIAQDLLSFSFLSRLMDYDKSVKPGRFVLKPNMTNLQ